ncbi:hypothetical protein Fmac_017425 [Flemingia macrophylla]|uniref:O-methyltransferase dimerisation domain-containing protein n=1 Tax=Flemingia macrophylla TaxID=520843 RepID=A0ABD1M237_9FABA
MSKAIMASNSGRKASEIFRAQTLLYNHLNGVIDTMCIKWIVDLGIPDIIHNHAQPITFPELVSILQVAPTKVSGVQSLMHYLAHKGFFEIVRIPDNIEEPEAYALTAASELLVQGSDLCLVPMVKVVVMPAVLDGWHQLKKWTYEDDLTLSDISLGSPLWDFLQKKPGT